jgi:phenylacetate-CoA ligase
VVIAALAGESWSKVIAREFITDERRHTIARWLGVSTREHQRLLILPADFSSRTQRTIYSARTVVPRRPVHYHHLPPTVPFEVAAAHIAAIRPRVIFSFGSYVDQFFHYLEASGSRIYLPRLWVYLGDRTSKAARALANARNCVLYSVYGAMEAGTIGFQCEEMNGFHLNTDLCTVRIVDDEGRDVETGRTGHIVISPLDNRAMALFNYRIGDRGALSNASCPCGRTLPLLAQMEGRQSELLTLGDGREISSLALEALFAGPLRQTVKAQIAQPAPGVLAWHLVPFGDVDRTALKKAIIDRGDEVLGKGSSLSVTFVDDIALTAAGKFPRAVITPSKPHAS